jgi:hypothetical protein
MGKIEVVAKGRAEKKDVYFRDLESRELFRWLTGHKDAVYMVLANGDGYVAIGRGGEGDAVLFTAPAIEPAVRLRVTQPLVVEDED